MSKFDQQQTSIIAQEAVEWLLTFEENSGDTKALRKEFLQWIKLSPLHIKEFLYASSIYHDIQSSSSQLFFEEILKDQNTNVVALTDFDLEERSPEVPKRQNRNGWLLPVSMAAMMVLVLFAWLFLLPNENTGSDDVGSADMGQLYATNIGEQSTVLLPDGTSVRLNTNTQIKLNYSASFRSVELIDGEAIFDVAKDPDRPFKVNVGKTVAEALGTSFNVYRQNDKTIITVVEGVVKVIGDLTVDTPEKDDDINMDSKLPYQALKSGDQVIVQRNGEIDELAMVDPEKVTAWTSQRLVFEGVSLETVVNEINRYNLAQITLESPELKNRQISGVFSTHDPKILLTFLSKVSGILVERKSNEMGWYLSVSANN